MDLISQCRHDVFKQLWAHYNRLVPTVAKLIDVFKQRGDEWIEDHVAYRTLPGQHTGAHVLQGVFEALGYTRQDDYHFEAKQLKAFWLAPPDIAGHSRAASPKIFVSELIPHKFSPEFQEIVRRLSSQVATSPLARILRLRDAVRAGDAGQAPSLVAECVSLLTTAPAWNRSTLHDYQVLKRESEYASWTMLFGQQINHFTLSVHLMQSFKNIAELAEFLEKDQNLPMNHSGGIVKGSSDLMLEQISSMAVDVDVPFQEGLEKTPYGFVEFAYRYPLPGKKADGLWSSYYQGFVTSNADKIFESTFR